MSNVAVSFESVSKAYRGAHEYRALRDDLVGVAGRLVGRKRPPRGVVHALDDVSFEVAEGESFAIVGSNGAGKTTALKLATRITYPSAGRVRVRGRVGALLEVGTGMHPELSGRENIRLYGRILGLSGRQIDERFERIVEFAGVAAAIDQPVKQYSSGMTLRLGFSVAAHLEPDVLLVDEAIAVGDAGFQYRCVERMAELVREGRTLVFVSHDMTAVETLCSRALLLRGGRIAAEGAARDVVSTYLRSVEDERLAADAAGRAPVGGELEIVATTLHDADGAPIESARAGEPVTVRLHYRAHRPVVRPIVNVGLVDSRIGCFTLASMLRDGGGPELLAGDGHLDCRFHTLPLHPRVYEIWCGIRGELGYGNLVAWQRLRLFKVDGDGAANGKAGVTMEITNAPVRIPYSWAVPSVSVDG